MDAKFPNTNYIGNKNKIADWIVDKIEMQKPKTVVDVFSGGGSISFEFKKRGIELYCNDSLYSNWIFLESILNSNVKFNIDKLKDKLSILKNVDNKELTELLKDKYFPNEINELGNILNLRKDLNRKEKIFLELLIRRAMIRKMPYSRMNIKWEKIEILRDEEYSYEKYGRKRSYHNKTFKELILNEIEKYNNSIFKGKEKVNTFNLDVIDFIKKIEYVDAIYLDPPYPGTLNNYDEFYGLIDKVLNFKNKQKLDLTTSLTFEENFMKIINAIKTKTKFIYVSLNEKTNPPYEDFVEIFKKIGNVKVHKKEHIYKIKTDSKNRTGNEILLEVKIGK